MTTAIHGPVFSPVAPKTIPQQDAQKVMLMADKFCYSAAGQEKWAERAREAVRFLEGQQLTDLQKATLENAGRPALALNKILPLVRLIMGFHANNRTDTTYLPGHDGSGTEAVAKVLTHQFKSISELNQLTHVDGEVMLDGLSTGRGYWRHVLDFEDNDLGEVAIRSVDPFTVYIDPDADTYDPNDSCGHINLTRWASIDEIEFAFGKQVSDLVKPFTNGKTWNGFTSLMSTATGEITAERSFAEEEESFSGDGFRGLFHDNFVDPARKNIRVLETEYYITEKKPCFIDLETGDRKVIPDHWDRNKVQKVLMHAEKLGNPLDVRVRKVRRVRWVQMVGDIIVHDDWSPYEQFSIVPFFPYFRRGKTKGMVEDLIDPQREYNKNRMSRSEILAKTANGGWKYEDGSMDPMQERNLKNYGAAPGFQLKYREGKNAPEQIEAQSPSAEFQRQEEDSNNDIREIAGINESMLGQLDRVQSGRAIEARQRQAVIGLQMYMDNFTRSKELQGRKVLNMVQRFYTEERIIRVVGEDGSLITSIINQPNIDPYGRFVGKLNDVTIGKYQVVVDETPMSASFQNAQFEEAILLAEKMGLQGPAAMAFIDVLIDLSSMPRKDEIKERMKAAMGMTPETAMQPAPQQELVA